MTLSPDLAEMIAVARDYLADSRVAVPAGGSIRVDHKARAYGFAETIVALTDRCVIGLPCARHGAVHGHEAEELRAGVEQILRNTADADHDDASFVLEKQRKALIFLLDRINACDSLAFLVAADGAQEEKL